MQTRHLNFFDRWDRLEDAGFTFAQLNYLVLDKDNSLKPIKPSKKFIISLAKTIYDGLIAIDNAHRDLPVTDELTIKMLKGLSAVARKELLQKIATEELVRSKVSLLFDQASVESVIGLLQGTIVYSTPAPASLVKTTDEFTKKFPGATPAEKQASAMLLKKITYDFNIGALQVTGILTTKRAKLCKGLFKNNIAWGTAFDAVKQALYIFDDLLTDVFKTDLLNAKKILLDGDVKNPDDTINDTAPIKREYFLEIFLPFLREKLTEKF